MTAAMPVTFPPVEIAAELARGVPGRCPRLAADEAFLEGAVLTWFSPAVALGHNESSVVLLVSVGGVRTKTALHPDEAERLGQALQVRAALAYQAGAIATAKAGDPYDPL